MDIDCTDVFKGTSRGRNAVALITYQSLGDILNGSFFSDRRGPKEVKINSQVISGSIGVKENVNLAKPVFLTFQHTRPVEGRRKYICVYWKGSEEGAAGQLQAALTWAAMILTQDANATTSPALPSSCLLLPRRIPC